MIRIVIAGPTRLYREGIELVLKDHDRIRVAGTAASAAQALHLCAEMRPDVALFDWSMEDCLTAVRSLASHLPDCKTVLLAVPNAENELMACVEAGVRGFVTHDTSINALVEVIEAAAMGELRCSATFACSLGRRVAELTALAGPGYAASPLTPREVEVLRQIESGFSNKEIANRMGIEVATVKNHVHSLLEKLPARSRTEAAAIFRRWKAPLSKTTRA